MYRVNYYLNSFDEETKKFQDMLHRYNSEKNLDKFLRKINKKVKKKIRRLRKLESEQAQREQKYYVRFKKKIEKEVAQSAHHTI